MFNQDSFNPLLFYLNLSMCNMTHTTVICLLCLLNNHSFLYYIMNLIIYSLKFFYSFSCIVKYSIYLYIFFCHTNVGHTCTSIHNIYPIITLQSVRIFQHFMFDHDFWLFFFRPASGHFFEKFS